MAAKKSKSRQKKVKGKAKRYKKTRTGISKTEDYRVFPEFVIFLSDEECENLNVNPKNIDDVLKEYFLNEAVKQFKNNNIEIPKDISVDDVRLCDCNKRVGIISNPNLASFQGDPIVNDGGRPQGHLGDVNSYINLSQLVLQSGFISHPSCCNKASSKKEQANAIQVGVLDSAVDINHIYAHMLTNFPDIDPDIYSVVNKSCQTHNMSSNTSHGTMVVISLLEKLFGIKTRKKRKPVCINVYNVARDVILKDHSMPTQVISQADVVCALLKAADENMYLNMSFGFSYHVNLIESVIKQIMPLVKFITCSAGNDKVNLSSNLYANYPSQFARDFDTSKIKEVRGYMLEKRKKNLWKSKNPLVGSNDVLSASGFNNYKLEWEDAVLDTINLSGGTSFASPRLLAKLIFDNS